ncbi:MAG: GntR family transcriptional regulator, partial [Pollutimonas bauzanensis]
MDLHIPRENSSLRQQVTDRLREAVLSGTFEPGQKLVERDLCEMLGISRTVLRESLQYLGAEGLITNIPHKGPVVSTISYQEAKDIYAVRQALEALAGEGFALHATDAQVQALRAALGRLEAINASPQSTHS